MDIRQCYELMGADYDKVLNRLADEQIIKKFALKFLNDETFKSLDEALSNKDAESAFRAAHTLKGVCLNLGFDNLYKVSSDITEELRGRELGKAPEMFEKVKEQYEITVDAISKLQ